MSNAIETNRVGHAYLVHRGARSRQDLGGSDLRQSAQLRAGADSHVPVTPATSAEHRRGEDVDVLEIDGASNRGIDEIRQLRSNVNVRPSRSRFKIYIIDEVHMLTKEAFNALLKTLEEPPEHVKFIFCTTDPDKIPITVLSRCQRFDFAPVEKAAIVATPARNRRRAKVARPKTAALELLARRAAGSMRDSQSLLEQLLSFSGTSITVDTVHALLGTADAACVAELASALLARDAAESLRQLDQAVSRGVDVGQLTEQLLAYLRDVMVALVGGSGDLLRQAPASELNQMQACGEQWGLETILAAVQILDQALTRMRQSVDQRTLIEVALIRLCHLADLQSLSAAIGELRSDSVTTPAASAQRATAATSSRLPTPGIKKKIAEERSNEAGSTIAPVTIAPVTIAPVTDALVTDALGNDESVTSGQGASKEHIIHGDVTVDDGHEFSEPLPSLPISARNAHIVWDAVVQHVPGIGANFARKYSSVNLLNDDQLVVKFEQSINADRCRRPEQQRQLESILAQVAGRHIRIDFQVVPAAPKPASQRQPSQQALIRHAMTHPLVKQASELFDADVTRVVNVDSSKPSGQD